MALPTPGLTDGSAGGEFKSRPFLRPKDIKKGSTMKFTILECREAPSAMEFSDVLLDVKNGKSEYTLGLRAESRNYQILFERFGPKPEKWKGKSFTIEQGFAKKFKKETIRVIDWD